MPPGWAPTNGLCRGSLAGGDRGEIPIRLVFAIGPVTCLSRTRELNWSLSL